MNNSTKYFIASGIYLLLLIAFSLTGRAQIKELDTVTLKSKYPASKEICTVILPECGTANHIGGLNKNWLAFKDSQKLTRAYLYQFARSKDSLFRHTGRALWIVNNFPVHDTLLDIAISNIKAAEAKIFYLPNIPQCHGSYYVLAIYDKRIKQ